MTHQPVSPVNPVNASSSSQIQTKPVRVLVTTEDYEIEGFMHIKPGGYQSRISDLLNIKDVQYVPITEAVFRKLRQPDEPPRKTRTLIIRLDTVKMVVPLDDSVNDETV